MIERDVQYYYIFHKYKKIRKDIVKATVIYPSLYYWLKIAKNM
jgi:hypothetical protein